MSRITYLTVLALIIMQTASGAEIFMSTRESLAFSDNLTLLVVDVNPRAGLVWLELRGENGTLKSTVQGAGDSFAHDGINLTVTRIYAGASKDLVGLEIVSGELAGESSAAGQEAGSNGSETQDGVPSSGMGATVPFIALVVAMVASLARRV